MYVVVLIPGVILPCLYKDNEANGAHVKPLVVLKQTISFAPGMSLHIGLGEFYVHSLWYMG